MKRFLCTLGALLATCVLLGMTTPRGNGFIEFLERFFAVAPFDVCQSPTITDPPTAVSVNTVVAGLGATPTTAAVNCPLTATANVTIPATVSLKFTYPGCLAPASGVTITHLGAIEDTMRPIVCGDGAVSFTGNLVLPQVRPEWWGCVPDGVTSCRAATQAAVTAIKDAGVVVAGVGHGGTVALGIGRYGLDSPVFFPRQGPVSTLRTVRLVGQHRLQSRLVGLAGFPTGKGMIMWDESHASWTSGTNLFDVFAWNQVFEKIGFELPLVDKTYGIFYTIPPHGTAGTNPSNLQAVIASLHATVHDVYIIMDSRYHEAGIQIDGRCYACVFDDIHAEPATVQLDDPPYNPYVIRTIDKLPLEAVRTPYSQSIFNTDAWGLIVSTVSNVNHGERVVAFIGAISARMVGGAVRNVNSGFASTRGSPFLFTHSANVELESLYSEASMRVPGLKILHSADMAVHTPSLGRMRYYSTIPQMNPNVIALARSAIEVEGSRNVTFDNVGVETAGSYSGQGFLNCKCESGVDIGKICTTATSPCNLTLGGITCSTGSCLPQITKHIWQVARCAGGANDGLECFPVCQGGTMPGYPCFADGDCLGGGVCAGAEASLQGPQSPGTGANNACGGTNWIDTGNVTVADGVYAASNGGGAGLTACLQVTNFGFTVDAGQTIQGFTVEPKKRESAGSSDCVDVDMRLMKAGVPVGTNHSLGTEWTTNLDSYTLYGNASDLWGTTWTPAEVNAADFGFQIQANCTGGAFNALMDHARITVASVSTTGVPTPCPGIGVCTDTNANVHYKSTQLIDRWQLETMLVRPTRQGNSLEGTVRSTPNEHTAVGLLPGVVMGEVSWDPSNLVTGTAISTTVTVPRVNNIGDPVVVSFSLPIPAKAILTGQVTAVNSTKTSGTVTVTLLNMTGSDLNLGPGTLHVEVLPR